MKKRLLFHLLHFFMFNLLIYASVYIYYAVAYPSRYVVYSLNLALDFIMKRPVNFILVSLLTYLFCYASGLIKFTIVDKYFKPVVYLREVFKFLLILGMISFVEFFVFYTDRIGRLIYVYFFVLYSFYYLIYLIIRSERGPRGLIWRAAAPIEEVFEKYIAKPGNFKVLAEEDIKDAGPSVYVVYQDGFIDEQSSESLIKDKLAGLSVLELAELVEKQSGKIPLDYVKIHWFLEKFDVTDRNYFRMSRMFNIVTAALLLTISFLPGLLAALLNKLSSKGPLFFVQERTGLHGRVFKLIKFRSMIADAEAQGARFVSDQDPRVTKIGRFMRRFRLDEIPQFINVLKGDMSLVGPRPEREVFIESLHAVIPYYKLRLLVHPGLTGWAQINGAYAGDVPAEHKEKLEFDLFYIKNRSIFMDLMILLRTVKTIVMGKGK